MKRYFIIPMLLLAAAFSAQAQENGDAFNEKFFEAKILEFVYQLVFTDAQKAAFVPVYKQYDEAMKAALGKPEHHGKPETKEAAAAVVKARIERQQKAQAVRLDYVDAFADVLEPRQLLKLFKVETQIQNKLKAPQGGQHDGHGQFGPGGQGGPGKFGLGGPGKGAGFQGRPGPRPGSDGQDRPETPSQK